MATRRADPPIGLPPPRRWRDLPTEAWLRVDRQDEIGESQFAVPNAWMEDPSVWEDIYEDNLAKGVCMHDHETKRTRHDRSEITELIREALADGPRAAAELRELTGLNGYFSQFMRGLRDDGIVVMPKRGTYELPSEDGAGAEAGADAGAELQVVEADWLMKLRIIADYEGYTLETFVQRLLDVYSKVRTQ